MIAQRLGSRLGLALLLVAVASHGKVDAERIPTAPAFLWGPRAIVGGPSGRQQQVSYQVRRKCCRPICAHARLWCSPPPRQAPRPLP